MNLKSACMWMLLPLNITRLAVSPRYLTDMSYQCPNITLTKKVKKCISQKAE